MANGHSDTAVMARKQIASLRTYLNSEGVLAQVRAALPQGTNAERAVRQVLTLVQQTPGLLDCTQLSIQAGLVQAAELGLELSGPLGQAFLVPRFDKRQGTHRAIFQVGYRGYLLLAHNTGRVRFMNARIVYAGDHFAVRYGTDQKIRHIPDLGTNRGTVVAYYAAVGFTNGGVDFEVMTREEAERFRDRFAASRGPNSPWTTSFDAMALKTCLRALAKRCPLSTELQIAAGVDESGEIGVADAPALDYLTTPSTRADQVAELLDDVCPPEAPEQPAARVETEGGVL